MPQIRKTVVQVGKLPITAIISTIDEASVGRYDEGYEVLAWLQECEEVFLYSYRLSYRDVTAKDFLAFHDKVAAAIAATDTTTLSEHYPCKDPTYRCFDCGAEHPVSKFVNDTCPDCGEGVLLYEHENYR